MDAKKLSVLLALAMLSLTSFSQKVTKPVMLKSKDVIVSQVNYRIELLMTRVDFLIQVLTLN